jgi:predicted metalloprotease with PDZ domain
MTSRRFRPFVSLMFVVSTSSIGAHAQNAITLHVDASQVALKIVRVHMEMPAKPGPLTLYYPKWIPGEHAPDGPIANVAGLEMKAGGETVRWERDLLDVYTFHVNIPEGAGTLEISFDYIEPSGGPYSGGASATDKLDVIAWNQDVLYPAGTPARQIVYKPTLRLPEGWKCGTPLPVERESGNEIKFKPVDLERLVDSPVITGQYYQAVDVTPPGDPIHHEMDLAGDSAAAIDMSPELRKEYTNLVAESSKLFGSRHYRDYHFLLTLSEHVAHFGLEHNESNDSRVGEYGFTTGRVRMASLLPHEFAHSWNGKFRRPADLATPDFEQPMKTDLLWVYEGLTDYLGPILTARSGLWTPEEYRDYLAGIAAALGPGRPGRTWRDLQDTTLAPLFEGFGGGWQDWKRGDDYYDEGDLVWLWVDTTIRSLTRNKKSIDDFCHIFHGGPNNGPEVKPYTFDEIVNTLNQVAPYDWAKFFHERLTSLAADAPVGGIEAGGWKVEYTDQDSRGGDDGGGGPRGPSLNATYSIGLRIGGDGHVQESIWDGPAFQAGVVPGMEIVAVNGRRFTPEIFNTALRATKTSNEPLQLLVVNDDYYRTVTIDYHAGPRYPHLVRIEGKPDLLSDIIKARSSQ